VPHPVSLSRRRRRAARSGAGLPRRLRRRLARTLTGLRPARAAGAAACDAERYREHVAAFGHLGLLVFRGLTGSPSLRTSCGLFAASNTSRPPAFVGGLLPGLPARGRARAARPSSAPSPGRSAASPTRTSSPPARQPGNLHAPASAPPRPRLTQLNKTASHAVRPYTGPAYPFPSSKRNCVSPTRMTSPCLSSRALSRRSSFR
jgi:hypothetical protein